MAAPQVSAAEPHVTQVPAGVRKPVARYPARGKYQARPETSRAKRRWCSSSRRRASRWAARCANWRSAGWWSGWRARAPTCGRCARRAELVVRAADSGSGTDGDLRADLPRHRRRAAGQPACVAVGPRRVRAGSPGRSRRCNSVRSVHRARCLGSVLCADREAEPARETNLAIVRGWKRRAFRWCCWTAASCLTRNAARTTWWASTTGAPRYMATEHLLNLGQRGIDSRYRPAARRPSQARIAGFREAHAAAAGAALDLVGASMNRDSDALLANHGNRATASSAPTTARPGI